LRCDLHTLFDLGLVGVDPTSMTVLLAGAIDDPDYLHLRDMPLHLPDDAALRPSADALQQHRERWGL
jgi:hypothetical protein